MKVQSTPSEALEKAVQQLPCKDVAIAVFRDEPTIYAVAMRLATHLLDVVPGSGKRPLLADCIEAGISAIDPESPCILSFTSAATEPLAALPAMAVCVRTPNGIVEWDFLLESMQQFLSGSRAKPRVRRLDGCDSYPCGALKNLMAAKLLTVSDFERVGWSLCR